MNSNTFKTPLVNLDVSVFDIVWNFIVYAEFWQIGSLPLVQKRGKHGICQSLREKFWPYKRKQPPFLHNSLCSRWLFHASGLLYEVSVICNGFFSTGLCLTLLVLLLGSHSSIVLNFFLLLCWQWQICH